MTINNVIIVLPIPHRFLSPNHTVGSRGGRMAKAKQTKLHRILARLKANAAGVVGTSFLWPSATVQITYYFKDARSRDRDNCLAWCKAYMDGIADSGLVANDAHFTYLPVKIEKDAKEPRVVIEVTWNAIAA